MAPYYHHHQPPHAGFGLENALQEQQQDVVAGADEYGLVDADLVDSAFGVHFEAADDARDGVKQEVTDPKLPDGLT